MKNYIFTKLLDLLMVNDIIITIIGNKNQKGQGNFMHFGCKKLYFGFRLLVYNKVLFIMENNDDSKF